MDRRSKKTNGNQVRRELTPEPVTATDGWPPEVLPEHVQTANEMKFKHSEHSDLLKEFLIATGGRPLLAVRANSGLHYFPWRESSQGL
jgi:hypothetical protein